MTDFSNNSSSEVEAEAGLDNLHFLGRLSKKFPQKAAKRALWAFCTPPRLSALPLPASFPSVPDGERLSSRDGLVVWRWGAGPQPRAKVLLVHGWGLQAESMRAFVPGFLAEDFEIYAFDGPAHGASPGVRTTGAEFVRAVLALSEEYGPFHAVVGHSVGAAASSIAMGKGAAIGRAALMAPAFLPDIIDSFSATVDLPAEVKDLFVELLKEEARSPLEDWATPNLAHLVQQPLIIFHDPADEIVSVSHSRRFVELAASATLRETPGAGHNRILQNVDVVAQIVDFLARDKKEVLETSFS